MRKTGHPKPHTILRETSIHGHQNCEIIRNIDIQVPEIYDFTRGTGHPWPLTHELTKKTAIRKTGHPWPQTLENMTSHGPKPYEFIRQIIIHAPKPYEQGSTVRNKLTALVLVSGIIATRAVYVHG